MTVIQRDRAYARLRLAYRALREFDAAMDAKYGRDPACNRRESLSLDEMEQLRRIEVERGDAARESTEEDYVQVVAEFDSQRGEVAT